MKILVIGGSYFLGKHFVKLASGEHEITVFNRGNRPLQIENVNEIIGDRNKREDLLKLSDVTFDVVVDFCAYNKGDILNLLNVIGNNIKQYIFISTVDVYKKGTNKILNENSPLETIHYAGEVGDYIYGKITLEQELVSCCSEKHIAYTSVRPVFIYGPDNYAPREGIFINWLYKAGQVLAPSDETGYFQMIYVEDMAAVLLEICGNSACHNSAINVCGSGILNYAKFLDALKAGSGVDFQIIPVTVSDILAQGISLPFPLLKEESEEYSSIYTDLFKQKETRLEDGLKNVYWGMHE